MAFSKLFCQPHDNLINLFFYPVPQLCCLGSNVLSISHSGVAGTGLTALGQQPSSPVTDARLTEQRFALRGVGLDCTRTSGDSQGAGWNPNKAASNVCSGERNQHLNWMLRGFNLGGGFFFFFAPSFTVRINPGILQGKQHIRALKSQILVPF